MCAEHATVRVQLVHHHDTQIAEQLPPASVIGQKTVVEDVWIGEQDRRRMGGKLNPFVSRRLTGRRGEGIPQELYQCIGRTWLRPLVHVTGCEWLYIPCHRRGESYFVDQTFWSPHRRRRPWVGPHHPGGFSH